MEKIIIFIIVFAAVVLLISQIIKGLKGDKSCCGCSGSDSCSPRNKENCT